MALAHGYALPFEALRRTGVLAQNTADATIRATADGATKEAAGSCLDARALEVQQRTVVQPSILVVPQLTRNGVVYNQIPNTRTNFIQNNTMTGATGSVAPTTWSVVAPPSGITIGYSASGQTTAADGTLVDYIDVTVSGTALTSGNFNLRPEPVTSTVSGNLLFASGMTYTASFYMSLLSGSVSGVSPNYQIQEVSGTTFVSGTSLDLSAITSNLTKYSLTRTLVGTGGADRIRTRYGHAIASGQVLNYTIRIASPQLEKGSVATPVIRTASGFVSVDMLGVARDGAPPDFTFTRNTTATRVNASGLIESVASGVPRIDWLGQSCPALLVEASGQNQALWSRDLSVSGTWAASGITAVRNAVGADGAASGATTLTSTAASATITQNISHASQSRIFSAYMRRVSGTGQIQLTTNGGTNWQTVTLTSAFAPFNSGAQTVTSGQVGIRMIASGDVIEVDFTQAEVGPVPTSPITTTSGAVSRAADVISASGALVSGLIGQTEGTIYAEVDLKNFEQNARIIALSDGTTNNRITLIFNTASRFRLLANVSTSGQVDLNSSAQVSGIYKVAVAYKENDYAFYLNGTQIGTDTSALVPACTSVFLGKIESSASTNFLNDRLRAAALYTTRLSNDQLAELTRL
jgi:hypothetical protein